MVGSVAWLVSLLADKGQRRYGLHDVTQLQHAPQSATFAEQAGGAPVLIAAALLHDIGHMVHDLGENPTQAGVDDRHEVLGPAFLVRYFPPEVTEPIRLHVAARRYLCVIEPDYFAPLSLDSVLSLRLPGGPMAPAEVAAFRAAPAAAVRLRRCDDAAKIKDLPTPDIAHFVPYLVQCQRDPGPLGCGRRHGFAGRSCGNGGTLPFRGAAGPGCIGPVRAGWVALDPDGRPAARIGPGPWAWGRRSATKKVIKRTQRSRSVHRVSQRK